MIMDDYHKLILIIIYYRYFLSTSIIENIGIYITSFKFNYLLNTIIHRSDITQ